MNKQQIEKDLIKKMAIDLNMSLRFMTKHVKQDTDYSVEMYESAKTLYIRTLETVMELDLMSKVTYYRNNNLKAV